ncbi:MAG TPA: pilus assembly protein PilM [Candidatus Omnitrophota bacterium]|nr:pilus assembly protein PilM [Candidatus Omnitrophota bacterium]HPD85148.1 pilus assembly protein PilM [Candidatus Omnitrophota bacterium]HRZ04351.1 pilus assembly protein PilM [Candidatus Omnitrophota bacterium]
MGLLQGNKDYISVAFGEEELRVAHMRMSTPLREVVNLVRRDIRGISEEELPKIIRSALNDFNIKKAVAVCIVPASLTTTKNIEIPSLDPNEIKSIINLQAGRHTPYSREEIIIDYINIGVFQRNYSKVLLIIVNRNVIKKHLNILEQAGLDVQKVFFTAETIARFYAKALNRQEEDAPLGIVDVGGLSTDFIVEFKGTVIACRNIPVGASHLAGEGQAAYTRLTTELKKSIEAYQTEDIEKLPEEYVLTSDHNHIKDLQSIFKESLKINAQIVPYIDNVRMDAAARKLITDSDGQSFLDIIAPVCTFAESQIDLLPDEIKVQRSIESQGKQAIKTGIFTVVIIVLICTLFSVKIYFKSMTLNRLKTNYKQAREDAKALEHISEKTRLIKDYMNSRLISLDALNELYNLIPDEVYLNSVNIDEKGTITIQGTSESMSLVFSLVGTLENSTFFKGVKTTSTTARKERGKDVAAFEIVFRLESAKDDESETEESTDNADKAEKPQEKK